MERGGHGVAFGIVVKAGRRLAQGQERVKVAGCACADVGRRHRHERKIKEHDLERAVVARAPDGDVVGLDVAMGDAPAIEIGHHANQVFAKSLKEFGLQTTLLAEPCAECLDSLIFLVGEDGPHQEASRLAQLDRIDERHDTDIPVVQELLEDRTLRPNTVVVFQCRGCLEDQLLGASARLAGHEQGNRAGALPDAALHAEATGQHVAHLRVDWVFHLVAGRVGELLLGEIEVFEKLGRCVESLAHVRVRSVADEVAEWATGCVEHRCQLEAAGLADHRGEFRPVGRRRLPREDVVGDCAE